MDITAIKQTQTAVTNATNATTQAAATEETNETLFEGEVQATTETQNLNYVEDELDLLESIGEKIGLDLTGDLETDFDALNEYPGKLDEMLAKIEKLIEEKMQELKDLENQQATLLNEESQVKVQLDKLNNDKLSNQKQQEELGKEIAYTNENNLNAQAEFQANYNAALADAEAKYNPETDGDKEEFINNQMSGFGSANVTDTTSMQGELSSLQSKSNTIDSTISTMNTTLSSIQSKLQDVDVQISVVKTEIDIANNDKKTIEAEKATIPAKAKEAIKAAVGPEEWGVIEGNNIDLSATLEDGSPRYMLAKGSQDQKYHLYDLGARDGHGRNPSVVRQNAPRGGFDIISRGNGYIKRYTKTEDGAEGSSKTFKFTLSDTSFSSSKESAKLVTESPLAFDLNGGGFQTSNELIKYDIDGDGKLDNINNVLEGVLAFDLDKDGVVGENGKELFGNNTDLNGDGKADGYKNGFEALKALAFKENLVNGNDDMALDSNDLNFLTEKYGLTMKMGYNGESQSLESLGITQINLAKTDETHLEENFDGKSNQLMTQEGATFVQDGKEKDYADVWNAKK